VESRSVSQVIEIECRVGKIAHSHSNNTEQSYFYVYLRRFQVGMLEDKTQDQPLCFAGKVFY
jgi:hypothetical protein